MVKQAAKGHSQEDIIATVSYFHINVVRFKSKDINFYKDLKDLEDEVKEVSQTRSKTQQRKEVKASGSDDIYEDDEVIVKHIKEKDACQVYGAGTKWCITMSDAPYWEQYIGANVVFYYMLRKQPLNDDFDKVAFAVQRDDKNNVKKIEYYNVKDDEISEQALSSYFKHLSKILNLVSGHASNVEKGLLTKIKDKEATKEEIQKAFDLYEDDPKTLEYLLKNVDLNKVNIEMLIMLASHENSEVCSSIASNPSAPSEVLIKLASDKDVDVRSYVASNPSTPSEVLIKLASDKDFYVCSNVAGNPSTPTEALIRLASAKYWVVRSHVAKNPSTPQNVLIKLASDENQHVRYHVVDNPSAPTEALKKLLNVPGLHAKAINAIVKRQEAR
jgi:hypothetical protein